MRYESTIPAIQQIVKTIIDKVIVESLPLEDSATISESELAVAGT